MKTKSPMYFIPLHVCQKVVDVAAVVKRVEEVYRWHSQGQVILPDPEAMRFFYGPTSLKSHMKAVVLPALSVAGVRIVGYTVAEDGSGPSSPYSTRLILLMDSTTAEPIALIDEHYNYTLRTAASVAVAAKYLHPERPLLGLVGAGGVARALVRVFSKTLSLAGIYITSRRKISRERLVGEMQGETEYPIKAVDSIEEILAKCNLIVTATTTKSPLMEMSQIRPGTLICTLGSFELTAEIYQKADKVLVDDWNQICKVQDMKAILQSGSFSRDRLYCELGEVVLGRKKGREAEDEVIVVRTEGMAAQDVAIAHWTFQEAVRRGLAVKIAS